MKEKSDKPTAAGEKSPVGKSPINKPEKKAAGSANQSAAPGGLKIPANFESNPNIDEETKAKFRRELAAQERKRIRDLIRLRRDVEAEKSNAGIWAR